MISIKIFKVFFILFSVLLINLTFSSNTYAQEVNYRSQSLYIYKFTKYITWPSAYATGDFVIGVIGNSPIVDELTAMATLKKAGKGQRIIIRQFNAVEEISKCNILYISSSKSRELKNILTHLQNAPTLIVAEREGLAKKGASINFVTLDYDILKFDFNKSALEKHQLKISDELAKLGFSADSL